MILTIQPPDKFPLTFYRDNCADRALTVTRRTSFMLSGAQLGITVSTLLTGYKGQGK